MSSPRVIAQTILFAHYKQWNMPFDIQDVGTEMQLIIHNTISAQSNYTYIIT